MLLATGRRFARHSGVRAAVHRYLVVEPGLLDVESGKAFDRLAHDRQEGDYAELTELVADDVASSLAQATALVRRLQEMLLTVERGGT